MIASKLWPVLAMGLFVTAAAAQALSSSQVRLLKDADYYLSNATRQVQSVEAQYRRGVASARSIQQLRYAMRIATQKLGNATRRLAQLPAAHQRVAFVAKQVKAQRATLAAIEKKLSALDRSAKAAADLGNSPRFATDVKQLKAFARSVSRGGFFRSSPKRALALAEELPAIDAFRAALDRRYGALLQQKTSAAGVLRGELMQFDHSRKQLDEKVAAFLASVPADIERALKTARELGDRSAAERKPGLIRVGVAQQLERARDFVKQLRRWSKNPGRADRIAASVSAVEKRIDQQRASLAKEILAANRPVPDRYQGSDKKRILTQVRGAWLGKYPGDKILALAIPTRDWVRDTRWRWENDSLVKRDHSDLQVAILVQDDGRIATTYRAYLRRDHMRGGAEMLRLGSKTPVRWDQRVLLRNLKR